MGRAGRAADAGVIYHVLNRANARMTIFEKQGDYEAFEGVAGREIKGSGVFVVDRNCGQW